MKRIVVPILALLLASFGLVAPSAAADDPTPPSFRVDSAWTVARGAALQVEMTMTCPDKGQSRTYGINVWTPVGDAPVAQQGTEVRCARKATRVIALIPAPGPDRFKTGTREIHAIASNCYYPAPEEPGCFLNETRVIRTVTRRAFVPETMTDAGDHLQFRRAVLTDQGDLDVTYRLACEGLRSTTFTTTAVQTRPGGGVTRAHVVFYPDSIACGSQPTKVSYTVAHPYEQPFTSVPTVIQTEASIYEGCFFEGCIHAHDSRVLTPGW